MTSGFAGVVFCFAHWTIATKSKMDAEFELRVYYLLWVLVEFQFMKLYALLTSAFRQLDERLQEVLAKAHRREHFLC